VSSKEPEEDADEGAWGSRGSKGKRREQGNRVGIGAFVRVPGHVFPSPSAGERCARKGKTRMKEQGELRYEGIAQAEVASCAQGDRSAYGHLDRHRHLRLRPPSVRRGSNARELEHAHAIIYVRFRNGS
jgi:hypothetical protein